MYYPLSQITPNLYTNGGELVIADTLENYVGYYYETSTGEKYVGKIPQGNSNILLISPPLTATEEEIYSNKYVREFAFPDDADPVIDVDHSLINELNQIKYSYVSSQGTPKVRKIPTSIRAFYTQEDLDRGEYKRYFAKKANEFIYMEISLEDYKKLKSEDPKIAFDLYNCIEMWYDLTTFTDNGYSSIIERDNNWFGFSRYILNIPDPTLRVISTSNTSSPSSIPTSGGNNISTPSSTPTSGGGY